MASVSPKAPPDAKRASVAWPVLSEDLHPETLCVEAGARSAAGDPVSPALYLSTTYRQGGDHEYIRDGSPATEAFERVVGELEGGHAACFASGMAASAAVLDGLAARRSRSRPARRLRRRPHAARRARRVRRAGGRVRRPDRHRGDDRRDGRRGAGVGRVAEQPAARDHRYRRAGRRRPRARRAARRRRDPRHPAAPGHARPRRRLRRPLGDQVHRRPLGLPARCRGGPRGRGRRDADRAAAC